MYLCGPIIAIDFIWNRYVILTLDDGSGATIEVKIERVLHLPQNQAATKDLTEPAICDSETAKSAGGDQGPGRIVSRSHLSHARLSVPPVSMETTLENVKVLSTCNDSNCYALHLAVDGEMIDIATVMKAKGTLNLWHDTFQLKLDRTSVARGLDEESRIWSEYADFVMSTLSQPWRLSNSDIQRLEDADKAYARRASEREIHQKAQVRRHKQREDRRKTKSAKREAKESSKLAELSVELDGNPLDRLRTRRMPV